MTGASPRKKAQPRKLKRPTLDHEAAYGFPQKWIAGVDEVGRGCIAGPVVAACVLMPTDFSLAAHAWSKKVHDSKLVPKGVREELFSEISKVLIYGIGQASVEEIEQINIFHASHLAMVRAVAAVTAQGYQIHHLLADGKFPPKNIPIPVTAIVKGDQKCWSIASASILAKVTRDQMMKSFDLSYPGYGFAQHKGYGTRMHLEALEKLGVCSIHRRHFEPVQLSITKQIEIDF